MIRWPPRTLRISRNPPDGDVIMAWGPRRATVSTMSAAATRRAGWLVTGAAGGVALIALAITAFADASTGRSVVLVACLVAAFAVAGWRAVRARADTTAIRGVRSLRSWIAAFAWAATTFSVLVALAAPSSGPRAALAGVLAGCLLVLVGRAGERMSSQV